METEPLLVNTGDTEVRAAVDNGDENQVKTKVADKRGLLALNIITFFFFVGWLPTLSTTDLYAKRAIAQSFNITNFTGDRAECLAGNSTDYREIQLEISSKTSMVMILVNVAGLVPQFLITFLLGPCSDQIGRKIPLMLPPVGGCLKSVIFLIISYYELNYYYLIVGSFVGGLFGAFSLFFTASIATIADLTDVKDRSLWLCVIDCTIALAVTLTNIAGGYIITLLGFSWMFLATTVTFVLCTILCATIIKEPVRDTPKVKVKIFTTLHMKRTLRIYLKDNGTNRRWKLLMLLAIVVTLNMASSEVSDAITFVLLSGPVCFTPELLGFFVACLYMSKTFGALGMMKINNLGIKEAGLLCVSIASYIAYELVLSWAYHLETLFVATLIGFGQLLANPLIRSLMSPLGSPDEQGAMFAAATWLQQLSILLGNMYQNTLYAATVSIWRGLFLLVGASVHGFCLLLVIILLIFWKREDMKKSNEGMDEGGKGPKYGSIQANTDDTSDSDHLPSI